MTDNKRQTFCFSSDDQDIDALNILRLHGKYPDLYEYDLSEKMVIQGSSKYYFLFHFDKPKKIKTIAKLLAELKITEEDVGVRNKMISLKMENQLKTHILGKR